MVLNRIVLKCFYLNSVAISPRSAAVIKSIVVLLEIATAASVVISSATSGTAPASSVEHLHLLLSDEFVDECLCILHFLRIAGDSKTDKFIGSKINSQTFYLKRKLVLHLVMPRHNCACHSISADIDLHSNGWHLVCVTA